MSSNVSGSFSDSITTQLTVHPRLQWLLIRVDVDRDIHLRLALDTLSAFSGLNEGVWNKLTNLGFLRETPNRGRRLLESVSIEGIPVPDLEVRLTRRPMIDRVDGYLGLSFFDAFTQVRIDVQSRRMTLIRR